MFTTIVAWVVFVLSSLIFIVAMLEPLLKSKVEKDIEEIRARLTGVRRKTSWNRVLVLFLFWFAAGWYLFG